MTTRTVPAFERLLDALTTNGHAIKTTGQRQAMAQCPAHPDRAPSLSLTHGETRVLVKCHAGCDTDDILNALHLTRADLFDEPRSTLDPAQRGGPLDPFVPCTPQGAKGNDRHTKVAEYLYRNETGTVLYGVTRCDRKCFRQWHPDPAGKYGRTWGLGGARPVPYRLPELLAGIRAGDTVWVTEGEKDVHTLVSHGITATCNSGGAGKWGPDHATHLRDADVIICADRDPTGKDHALVVVATLMPAAHSITVVQARHGKDATDHLTHPDGTTGNFHTVWEPLPWTPRPGQT